MTDETITLTAVASRLALTAQQLERARALLGGEEEAAVRTVLAACRQAQRETTCTVLPAHRLNADLVSTIVDAQKRERAA